MQTMDDLASIRIRRRPWNKDRFTGPKPPLQPRHVWAIRTRLQLAGQIRNLALFNLAIDSKLRGCDVVSLKVEDVAPHGGLDRRSFAVLLNERVGAAVDVDFGSHRLAFLQPAAIASASVQNHRSPICALTIRDRRDISRPRKRLAPAGSALPRSQSGAREQSNRS